MKINQFHIDLLLCVICPHKCLIPYKINKLGYLHFDLKKDLKCWTFKIDLKSDLKNISNVDLLLYSYTASNPLSLL